LKLTGNLWLKTLWKIVTHPAVEMLAAIVLAVLATWLVVSTEALQRLPHGQFPFMRK
jgi:hypothetical protein